MHGKVPPEQPSRQWFQVLFSLTSRGGSTFSFLHRCTSSAAWSLALAPGVVSLTPHVSRVQVTPPGSLGSRSHSLLLEACHPSLWSLFSLKTAH